MTFKAILSIKMLINSALNNIIKLSKPQNDFFIEIMLLFISIPGRMNFLQFGRYGKFGEQRYRQQFERQFDFLSFNKEITLSGMQILLFKGKIRFHKFQTTLWQMLTFQKSLFSTDLELGALEILQYYKTRFQIEFLYRDGKQHTGLNDCQARSENKLHFHFNASLSAINLAKVEHWVSVPKQERGAFSMSDVKTMYHNTLLLERFIDVFAVPAYKLKNNNNVKELINFGKITA